MKRCKACDEEFEDKFSFCPVDATPLNILAAAVIAAPANPNQFESEPLGRENRMTETATRERVPFRLTMMDHTTLPQRLMRELHFLIGQLKQEWPLVKRDPIGSGKRVIAATKLRLKNLLAAPNSIAAIATAVALLTAAGILAFSSTSSSASIAQQSDPNSTELVQIVELLPAPNTHSLDPGVGAGSRGRVGLNHGNGEGSAPQPKKSTGGGGGGNHDLLPQQQGRVPVPSSMPAPIPRAPVVKNQTLPLAGIDIDPLMWKNLTMAVYGDPISTREG